MPDVAAKVYVKPHGAPRRASATPAVELIDSLALLIGTLTTLFGVGLLLLGLALCVLTLGVASGIGIPLMLLGGCVIWLGHSASRRTN